jgi:hypothetical protein
MFAVSNRVYSGNMLMILKCVCLINIYHSTNVHANNTEFLSKAAENYQTNLVSSDQYCKPNKF